MSITVSSFGFLDQREAQLFTLTNASGASLSVCDYGAHVVSVMVPDCNGKLANVCLGFDDVTGYATEDGCYLGAAIGRVGNRIGGAAFDLNGTHYPLAANDHGNTLHGGIQGFEHRWFSASIQEGPEADILVLSYDSPDGEEGFPGNLHVEITYAWTDRNELFICYSAVSDADTIINLTNHSYFNLGSGSDILNHQLQLNAATMTETDNDLIPTGRHFSVSGLPVDFRTPLNIGDGLRRSA